MNVCAGIPMLQLQNAVYQIRTDQGPYNVRVLAKDAWGDPPHLAGRNFILAMPVEGVTEGFRLLDEILRRSDLGTSGRDPSSGQMGIEIGQAIHAEIGRTERTPGGLDPAYELRMTLVKDASWDIARSLFQGLLNLGLDYPKNPEDVYDLTTNSGRREWAYYSFLDWSNGLTLEEIVALRKVADADYREIHNALRRGDRLALSRWNCHIDAIDSAIGKGVIDREVTVYRAAVRDDYERIFERMMEGSPPEMTDADPAYLFTSLDPKMARWWKSSFLSGKGHLLEIKVPKGARAAYIDAKSVLADRGYLEMVFPRGTPLQATGARRDHEGNKILMFRSLGA